MPKNHTMSAREQLNDLREKILQDIIDMVLSREIGNSWPQWLYKQGLKAVSQSKEFHNNQKLKVASQKYAGYIRNVESHFGGNRTASKTNIDVTFGAFVISRNCDATKEYFSFLPKDLPDAFRTSRNEDDHDTYRDLEFQNNAVVFSEIKNMYELIEHLPSFFPKVFQDEARNLQRNWNSRLQEINDAAIQEAGKNSALNKPDVNDDQEEFRRITEMQEYRQFVNHILMNYYGKDFFTEINGKLFSVKVFPGKPLKAEHSILDFDVLSDYENSELSDFNVEDHQDYIHYPWYDDYSRILKGTIKYPDRPGYMLKTMNLNQKGEIESFSARIGTYAENVYGTHVLEYENYRLYQEFKDQNIDDPETWKKLRNKMTVRNQFHPGMPDQDNPSRKDRITQSLLSMGPDIHSLLSVQMLVAIRSELTGNYELKIVQRSKNVAIAPDVYQMIPAGGFEILNDSDDNVYDDIELESNFSAGCAVFREYLEELFNMPEFEGNGTGSIEERLLKDPHIVTINHMIQTGTAHLQFLRSVLDLAGLRHELSFALVIDDEKYSEQPFIANEESKKGRILERINVSQFENRKSVWNHLHGPSAGMWHLFKESDLYEYVLNQEKGTNL